MALATKEPDNDQKHNPAAWDESTGSRLSAAEQSALSDIENNYGATADSATENANIEKARAGEERGTSSTPNDTAPSSESPKKGAVRGARDSIGNAKDKLSLNFLKKKGPLALIGLLLGGGGGLFAALLSPGLALVQLKEALSQDLNDAVSAMDERAQHIFRAQQKKQTRGLCTRTVTVRCNYRSMSESQIKKLAKQGITVENDGERKKTPSGRYHVTSFKFIDSDGSPKSISADNFRQTYRDNPHFRGLMNRYYSPRWMSIRDTVADGVKKKFKLSFNRSVNGKNKSEMKDQLDTKVREGVRDFGGRSVIVVERDGQSVYVDADNPDGEPLRENGKIIDANEAEKQMEELKKQTTGGLRRTMSIGLTGANMVTGGAEAYCMLSKTIQMASMAARNIQYAQYMRYALVFLNSADASLLGALTPESAEFLGDILTKKDMRDKVLSEESIDINLNSSSDTLTAVPVDNPHKGKDAFDATSVKAAMYGGGEALDMREASTSFSGGLGNTMRSHLEKLRALSGVPENAIETTCNLVQNPIIQFAGLGISVAAIALTGPGAGAGLARAAGASVALLVAMNMLQSKITDMITGKSIGADSYGVDAGNAIFAGSGALFGSMASTRGMRPLSTTDEIRENMRLAHQEQERYTEVARLKAADTPFDIHNQYSFLGSMAWSLAPIARQSSNTVASIALSPIRFIANVPNWLAPSAQAAPLMSEKRFQQCDDIIYSEKNLNMQDSVDMMCNLRFGMSEAQRNADPEKVAQWMIDSCQVDPITGEPNLTGECPDGCNVNGTENNADTCQRTTSPEAAMAMLNSTQDQIANAMKYENQGIDQSITQNSVAAKKTAVSDQLPREISSAASPFDNELPRALQVTQDVRSYAHFLRYCRFGDEDGRTVNFGDLDVEADESGKPVDQTVLTGLPFVGNNVYSSTGKECLTSNNCPPEETAPNERLCRPPQYDMYEVYTLDQSILGGFDMEEEVSSSEGGGSGASTGEFGWPMAGEGTVITSCFAPRGGSFHGALDIAAAPSLNPEIIAADGGEVVMVRNGNGDPGLSGFGEAVVIKHDNGYYTRYSHMRAGSIVVREGDKVDKGQKLGIQGNTGYSFGDHLDFGIGKEMPPYNNNSENPMKLLTVPEHVINQAGCSTN